ncbi:hypothetical protein D9M68_532310 [compost metagenome]
MHGRTDARLRQPGECHKRFQVGIGARSEPKPGNPHFQGIVDIAEIECADAIAVVMRVDGRRHQEGIGRDRSRGGTVRQMP